MHIPAVYPYFGLVAARPPLRRSASTRASCVLECLLAEEVAAGSERGRPGGAAEVLGRIAEYRRPLVMDITLEAAGRENSQVSRI